MGCTLLNLKMIWKWYYFGICGHSHRFKRLQSFSGHLSNQRVLIPKLLNRPITNYSQIDINEQCHIDHWRGPASGKLDLNLVVSTSPPEHHALKLNRHVGHQNYLVGFRQWNPWVKFKKSLAHVTLFKGQFHRLYAFKFVYWSWGVRLYYMCGKM